MNHVYLENVNLYISTHHIVDVLVGSNLLLERLIQSTDNQIPIIFILHQLADAIQLQPTYSLTFQHLTDNLIIKPQTKKMAN